MCQLLPKYPFTPIILVALSVLTTSASWAILPSILDAPVELMITDSEDVSPDASLVQNSSRQSVSGASTDDPLTDLTRRLSEELEQSPSSNGVVPVQQAARPPVTGRVQEAAQHHDAEHSFQPLEQDVLRQAQRIQQQHVDVAHAVRDEDDTALADIALLWQTAVERSGTIRFAIEKLSRKNATGEVPKGQTFTNRMLKSLARVGGVAGTVVTGTPAGLVGGSMVEQMLQDSPTTSALTHVTDADMLLLAKEVETLQSSLIDRYYSYRHNRAEWLSARASQQELDRYIALLPSPKHGGPQANKWDPMVPLIESMRSTMDDTVQQAERDYEASRQSLSLLVGADALKALEDVKQQVSQQNVGS